METGLFFPNLRRDRTPNALSVAFAHLTNILLPSDSPAVGLQEVAHAVKPWRRVYLVISVAEFSERKSGASSRQELQRR